MAMQFGIFDHIEGMAGTSMRTVLRDRIELVKAADQAGFYAYHLAEHHGTDLCLAPNQEIFLAAAAEATSQIRLGPLVKILPLHHPIRVVEDICILDQLTGGRVEYGVGRGIAAVEHFWFEGDWFASHERFDEAIALVLQGLRTGRMDPIACKHYDFPAIDVSMSPFQAPNPPFWYPGNPVTAGRFGLNLVWPGPIPKEAYDLYVSTWMEHRNDPVRADAPGAAPKVGSTMLLGIAEKAVDAKAIAARGLTGLMRRIVNVHTFDHQVLDPLQAEAALNPLARGAYALTAPGGDALLPELTKDSGTPSEVRDRLLETFADSPVDYLILQLPTGDMTIDESRRTLELFIEDVMPALQAA
jgi:alkanesulfonate monooxygenase SsuD/methylene tetrahydromethanopterin reductase-like flavin-dependent oxidoreductase (luciferase family)